MTTMTDATTERPRVPSRKKARRLRHALGALLAFVAFNAFGGGIYGLTGAPDVPTEWLEGSPFADYFVPSLVLVGAVGGSCLLGAIAAFARWPRAQLLAFAASAILLAWIAAQFAIIGLVSWLQPAIVVAALSIAALARALARGRPEG